MQLTRDAAWDLVTRHTQNENLRKHMLAVEAAVRGYARMFGEEEEAWGFVALVHDFDYERTPDAENHPFRGVESCSGSGVLNGHARNSLARGLQRRTRESRLEHTLYACDEMSGS